MAFKMRGFPIQDTSALKSNHTDEDFAKLSKEEKLNKAKSNNTALPKETEIIDYWNRR